MSVPIRELIADVPAPGGDHRQNQPSTLCEQDVVEVRIVRADLVRHVRDVELDGSSAARLEVDEQQAAGVRRTLPGMRFAVQHLLVGATAADPFPGVLQRAQEQPPVGLTEPGGLASWATSRSASATRSRKCGVADVDAAQTRVQAVERVRVGGG